jgi:hypothetical protein
MPHRIEGVFVEEKARSPAFTNLPPAARRHPSSKRAAFLKEKFDLRKEKASNPQSNDRCALAN